MNDVNKKENLISFLGNILRVKRYRYKFILIVLLILASVISYFFITKDENLYNKTIAKITSITELNDNELTDVYGNVEQTYKQQIKATIMNGPHKGEEIQFLNSTSFSQATDYKYKVNDEVFVSFLENANKKIVSSGITDPGLKRDSYIAYIVILFILLMLLIGGFKGLRSLISVIINIIIFSVVVELYIAGYNMIFLATIASILFIILSVLIVSGINRKSFSAIIGTMAGTIISMLIALVVVELTKGRGINYEQMEFVTRPPKQVFMFEVLIGTLGGIIDIAISISSAIKEIYDKNNDIERKVLLKSGMEIGKDIMGTMANTLLFAYISGSLPMIILLLKNSTSVSNIINYTICLEIIRALTGSIGIVISIPITLYISVILLKNKKIFAGDL